MKKTLLIAYPFAGTGANMLRYKSLSYYLVDKGQQVDVIGYYELKEKLPPGIRYFRLRNSITFGFIISFAVFAFQYAFMAKIQRWKDYMRRVGLASMTYSLAMSLIKRNHYESCLISVAPWAYYLIVPRIKKRVKVIVDICDPLYQNAIYPQSCHRINFHIEQQALMCADCVITVNEPSIPILTQEMKIDRERIRFIPPAMQVGRSLCGEKVTYRLRDHLSMLYSGSLYEGYRDLKEIIPAVELHKGVSLDVYTNSSCRPCDSGAVKVHNIVPHNELLNLYQQFDILLFVDNFYGYQVPSKIFEMIAQNKPILFIYDKRNEYLFHLLSGQEGIIFVENKRVLISAAIESILRYRTITVHYTIDVSPYTEEIVNSMLCACL